MSKPSTDRRTSCGRTGHCLLLSYQLREDLPCPDHNFSSQIPLKSPDLNSLPIEVLYNAILQISRTADFLEKEKEFLRGKKNPQTNRTERRLGLV